MEEKKKKNVKINFWDDVETKEALKKQADVEGRDISGLLRFKIKKIREREKW